MSHELVFLPRNPFADFRDRHTEKTAKECPNWHPERVEPRSTDLPDTLESPGVEQSGCKGLKDTILRKLWESLPDGYQHC